VGLEEYLCKFILYVVDEALLSLGFPHHCMASTFSDGQSCKHGSLQISTLVKLILVDSFTRLSLINLQVLVSK
jgi:hypothetical protein